MFTIDVLRGRETKLAIATIAAAVSLLALLLLLGGPARPAHACLFTLPPGTNPFVSAPWLADSETCGKPGVPTRGNTTGATMEVGEPRPYSSTKDCGVFGVSNSVWWKVQVPSRYGSNGAYLRLSTGGSSFDTVLAVYQGSSLTSLQQVACSNDNSLPGWNEPLIERLSSGKTYYVQLSGTGGARSGSYQLYSSWRTGAQLAAF